MDVQLLFNLISFLRQLRTHEGWTRRQLEAHQAKELNRLREYAYARSPFYQQFHKGMAGRPLQELPVLTKAIMMENFDALVTDRSLRLEEVRAYAAQGGACQRYRTRYWLNATSGSSGQPGFFLFDRAEWLYILASFARSQEWSGVRIDLTHRQRMATVASISPWHMSSQVAGTANSWWRPSLRLPASQSLQQNVSQLNEWQPEVLITYASMAGILADEQLAGRLCIHPKVVYSASEVLTQSTRRRVRDAWDDEPYNEYAATETASIAAEHRECRRMHFFEDLIIVEVVDEQYRPVPPGEYGAKVLVTSLFSRTQPLIRYELSDSIKVSQEVHTCRLPFRILEDVQGRVEDTLQVPSLSGKKVSIQPLVFNRVMDIVPVSGWQIAQQSDDGLVVLLSGASDELEDADLIAQLTSSIEQEGGNVPYMEVKHVEAIPKTEAGKSPLIKAYRNRS